MIDWHSEKTEVLLNPRFDSVEAEQFSNVLKNSGNLKGHLWFTTSGTTGKFKFVALSKEAILHSAKAVNAHLESTSRDIWINVLPTFHVGGVGIFARGYLSGAKVVDLYSSNKRWDLKNYVDTVHEVQGTLSSLVPAQVHDIVVAKVKAPESIRAVVVGGGYLSRPIYENAKELGWNLLPSYGLTECSSQVATADGNRVSDYKILQNVKIQTDTSNRIQIMSPSLLTCYAFIERGRVRIEDPTIDGWFTTEDVGEINGGFLKVFGRGSDFLKVGGESVSLPAVQKDLDDAKAASNVLQQMVLAPHDDDRLGQVVSLYVQGPITKQIEALINRFNHTVMPYERIRHVFSVSEIPRNELGKPLMNELTKLKKKSP